MNEWVSTNELKTVALNTTYICKRTKELVHTVFWVGYSSVAVKYLNHVERYKDRGKVIPLSTFARCYEEFKER